MSQFALKLYVDGNTEVIPFVDDQLKTLQGAVDGYIEAITLTKNLILWVNEEAKLRDLPFNQAATSIFIKYRGGSDYILGSVVFTGGSDENGDTQGISEADIQLLKTYAAMSKVD